MDKKWKSGDVVCLKGGGPNMTVDSYVPRFVQDVEKRPTYSMDSIMRQDGENVRVTFFSKLQDGSYAAFPTSIEINENALKASDQ